MPPVIVLGRTFAVKLALDNSQVKASLAKGWVTVGRCGAFQAPLCSVEAIEREEVFVAIAVKDYAQICYLGVGLPTLFEFRSSG
ncbi:hypothetical protein IFU01_07755 [Oxalobacteraceae sp. CFBP 8763]|nr:hypothetical protein [Oxalobacteraceae sp. CFBP 8763]